MATKGKKQKLEEEPTLFVQPDVIIEVEGKELHVRKQVLAENSPVFRRMFQSNFKERRDAKILLPEKKYKDFEMFLRTFYHPSIECPITKDTVLSILPLAEEYEVLKVKERFENCMIKTLQLTTQRIPQIDIQTLLNYAANAELYNLSPVLPLVVQICAKYDVVLLNQLGIETLLSERMMKEIAQERNKLLQKFAILKIKQGDDVTMVFETLDILSGLVDKERTVLMKEYEGRLVEVCNFMYPPMKTDIVVKLIIAAEKFSLKNLLLAAVGVARKYHQQTMQESARYHEISDESRLRIYKR